MGESKIEWTDYVWNPVRGCIKITPGCKHCYAERFAERFRGVKGHAYEEGFDPRLARDQLGAPLHWTGPRAVFVNSMSDLFQSAFVDARGYHVNGHPEFKVWHVDPYLYAVACVMGACPHHTFQILTKRAEGMKEWSDRLVWGDSVAWQDVRADLLQSLGVDDDQRVQVRPRWPLPNVHLGVSVEDRKHGLPRVDLLRQTPAAVRWLSIEPLLEDVAADLDLTGIDLVVVGGESGPKSRPFNVDWARKILAKCKAARVPFFMKQVGRVAFRPWQEGDGQRFRVANLVPLKLASTKGNKLVDLPEDLRVRQAVGHYKAGA